MGIDHLDLAEVEKRLKQGRKVIDDGLDAQAKISSLDDRQDASRRQVSRLENAMDLLDNGQPRTKTLSDLGDKVAGELIETAIFELLK